MKQVFIALFTLPLFFWGCLPQEPKPEVVPVDCDGQACVINRTSNNIYYCWNCQSYNDTLLPGEMACDSARAIKITQQSSTTYETLFISNLGTLNITVDECEKIEQISRDFGNLNSAELN